MNNVLVRILSLVWFLCFMLEIIFSSKVFYKLVLFIILCNIKLFWLIFCCVDFEVYRFILDMSSNGL